MNGSFNVSKWLGWSLLQLVLCAGMAGAVVIPFTLDQPGNVSAAVYDQEGRLVREMMHAVPMTAGKQSMFWDYLDRDGNSLPAGNYTWKVLQTTGLKAKYLMSLGSNFPPGNDWRTACGPGTHNAPFGIAVDPAGIYVAANTTENIETCMLKMTPDGKTRLWSTLHPKAWDGALSLALDGGQLFMLGHTANSDGRTTLPKRQLVYVYDAATGALAARTMVPTAVGNVPDKLDVHWDPANREIDATDMDAHDGVLVVAYAKRNALRWYDPKTGEKLDTTEIDSPQGVTVGEKGLIYVSSGERIMTLSRENKTPEVFATGLGKPGRLDIDHASGDLLVYQQSTQQIARYSSAGKLLNTYGQPGGRKDGLYDDTAKRSFAGFSDMCADGAGGFYVTEAGAAPRRTAHFAADGTVVQEWYGGQSWAPHAVPEPGNPNVVWVESTRGSVMRVLVDYTKNSWTVHSCYQYSRIADGLVGNSANEGGYFHVYKHAGATYLALEKLPTILKVDEKAWCLLPVTVCGGAWAAPEPIKGWIGGNGSYQWNDANGDGLPQQEECTFYKGGIPSNFIPTVAADFSCFAVSGGEDGRQVNKFAVTRWNEAGAPVYGTMPTGEVFGPCSPRFDPKHFADSRWSAFLHQDAATGSLFAALNDWTRNWCDYDDSFMQKWSAEGKPLWTVGQRAKGKALPGEIKTHLRGIAGVAHDCVVAIDVDGGWNLSNLAITYVWDRDGLYVGGLMDSPDLNGIEKYWYQLGGEHCHSSVYMLPAGDVLFFGNWENEMRVYRISGWNDWQRQSGIVRITKPAAAHTGSGLATATFADAAMTKPRATTVDPLIDVSWGDAKPVPASVRWSGIVLPDYGPSYTGPWSVRADKECFEGTVRSARDNNASVSFRFHGSSIAVIGTTGPNGGFADIALDGVAQPQADCYSPEVKRNATLFAKEGLADGDHEVTVTVVGWYGKPRNKASSDAWVNIDKFVVDGREYDDAGLPYVFSANADGKLQLWLNREPMFKDEAARSERAEIVGRTVKLLRRQTPIQLNYSDGKAGGGVTLEWSSPFEPKQPLPTRCLYPVTPGGYLMENLRYVDDLPKKE